MNRFFSFIMVFSIFSCSINATKSTPTGIDPRLRRALTIIRDQKRENRATQKNYPPFEYHTVDRMQYALSILRHENQLLKIRKLNFINYVEND